MTMTTRIAFLIVFLSLLGLALSPNEALAQDPPMDFSDASEQLVQWPFTVVEYFVEEDGLNVYQHTRVAESSDHIYEYAKQIKDNHDMIGEFNITGVTKSSDPGHYNISLARLNVRYFVQVRPDGAGAELIVKSTPNAIVSGYFKRALYGYRLGDGVRVGTQRFDFMDE